MIPIFKKARWGFQLCFSLYLVFFFQKGKAELAGKDPHVLTFNQNSKIKHYTKTKFPPGYLRYFRDCENKSKLSWKEFCISWSTTVILKGPKHSVFSSSPFSLDRKPLCSPTSGSHMAGKHPEEAFRQGAQPAVEKSCNTWEGPPSSGWVSQTCRF